MYFFHIYSQGFCQFSDLGNLLIEHLFLGIHLARRYMVGHKGTIPMAAFEQSFGRQPLVYPKDRVLVDGQFGS